MPCAKCGQPMSRSEAGPSAVLCSCEDAEYVEPMPAPANGQRVDLIRHVDNALSIPRQGTPLPACPTNLDLRSMRGRALLFAAMDMPDYTVTANDPVYIRAVAWAMIPETRVSEETGEVSEFVSVCLWDEDGLMAKSSGEQMPMRLMALLQLFTKDEWAKGIPIRIEQYTTKRGRQAHRIKLNTDPLAGAGVPDEEAPPKKNRRK